MNQEQQRIAIAEACGWRFKTSLTTRWSHNKPIDGLYVSAFMRPNTDEWIEECHLGYSNKIGQKVTSTIAYWEQVFQIIPDYLNDLNAMHEAEKVLIRIYEPPSAHKDYDTKLWAKMRDDGLELNGYTWHATAAQRAEAFLKTLNLWEEE